MPETRSSTNVESLQKHLMLGEPTRRISIRVDKLERGDYQPRDPLLEDQEELIALANSIRNAGEMRPPPQVTPDPKKPGFYKIFTGHRRIESVAKYLGWTEVVCDVYDHLSDLAILYWTGADNLTRKQFDPYEKGLYFKIWQDKGFSVQDIAYLFNRNSSVVYGWITYYQTAEEYNDLLGPDGKHKLLQALTKDRAIILKQFKSRSDKIEAAKKIIENPGITDVELKEFLAICNKLHAPPGENSSKVVAKPTEEPDIGQEALNALKKAQQAEVFDQKHERIIQATEIVEQLVKEFHSSQAALRTAQTSKGARTVHGVTRYHLLAKDGKKVFCFLKMKGLKEPDAVQLSLDQIPSA